MASSDFYQMVVRLKCSSLIHGNYAIDSFFVISGFLITWLLLDEYDRNKRLGVKIFYIRRLLRLYPAYIIAVLIYCIAFGHNWQNTWANILYVNNYLPAEDQAMSWTWSLAVEEQFYLMIPLLVYALGFMPRGLWSLALLFGLILSSFLANYVIARLYLMDLGQITLWDQSFFRYFDVSYDKTHTRYGTIAIGIASAYLYRYSGVTAFLSRHTVMLAFLLVGGIAATHSLFGYVTYPEWNFHLNTFSGMARFVSSRNIFGFFVAVVLLASLGTGVLNRLLHSILSVTILYPFSQLSYSTFLIHPMVIFAVYYSWPPSPQISDAEMVLRIGVVSALSYGLAAIIYLLAEKPVMNLRPRV